MHDPSAALSSRPVTARRRRSAPAARAAVAALWLCGGALVPVAIPLAVPPAVSAAPADAASARDKSAKLETLRRTIKDLRTSLDQARDQRSELRGQLRTAEVNIGSLSVAIKKLEREAQQKNAELRGLRAQRDEARAALDLQRQALAQQIVAGYAMGRQGQLKIVLSQQDPSTVGRMLAYYDYFNRARVDRIGEIDRKLAELDVLQQAIAQQAETLEGLRDQRTEQLQALQESKASRRQILVKLGAEIKTKQQRLEALLQDERNLSELVIKLRRALAAIPPEPAPVPPPALSTPSAPPSSARATGPAPPEGAPFVRYKGRLSWPARGKITARYGSSRQVGALTWRGVMIGAEEGGEVKAIYRGRVAFADWLRGFGLLIIIDHGDGYMSLYGHNQNLAKGVGDWVERGDVIATVGNSGGEDSAGLYFEIRHNGVPDNPLQWCRADG